MNGTTRSQSDCLLFMQTYHELEQYKLKFEPLYYESLYVALTDTSHFTVSAADQISQAVENKYDAIKDKLLLEALMKQVCFQNRTMIKSMLRGSCWQRNCNKAMASR